MLASISQRQLTPVLRLLFLRSEGFTHLRQIAGQFTIQLALRAGVANDRLDPESDDNISQQTDNETGADGNEQAKQIDFYFLSALTFLCYFVIINRIIFNTVYGM